MPNEIEDLRDNAGRLRRLARAVTDARNQRQLIEMADQLDLQAAGLEEKFRRTK